MKNKTTTKSQWEALNVALGLILIWGQKSHSIVYTVAFGLHVGLSLGGVIFFPPFVTLDKLLIHIQKNWRI